MSELFKTPLDETHRQLKGKIVDFGGWALPIQYEGIKKEHEAVRTNAGLFDVSHMGEIEIKGEDSLTFLQKMMTNDVSTMKIGAAQYTAMCNEKGGTIDDLLIYKLAENDYLLVVNAANTQKDLTWLKKHMQGDVQLKDVSAQYALLALQGPASMRILQNLMSDAELTSIRPFTFRQGVSVNGKCVLLSRTGYTGEDGFEIYCRPEDAVVLWNDLLQAGEARGIKPCGLGARDTLRFEAGLVLYGQELSEDISPLEAGIGFAVKTNKAADFIGKSVLQRQKEQGVPRKLIGLEMLERGIPRTSYLVFSGEKEVGVITTGTQSPTLKKNIGLALVDAAEVENVTELQVEIRGKRLRAKIIPTPFYKRDK